MKVTEAEDKALMEARKAEHAEWERQWVEKEVAKDDKAEEAALAELEQAAREEDETDLGEFIRHGC